jgi:hypothetical protein
MVEPYYAGKLLTGNIELEERIVLFSKESLEIFLGFAGDLVTSVSKLQASETL